MSDTVRIVMIGTGGIAGGHAKRLLAIPEVQIVALADPNPDHIERFGRRVPELPDCPAFNDHEEMLGAVDADAAVICSPHNVHCQQILDCLEAGLHVLVEKPMVCSIEDAHRVMAKEREAGRMVAISYQRHAQAEFQFIRRHIEEGSAGAVQFVSAFQGQNWLRNTRESWRQVPEVSCGGQLNDSGSHLIDIILWVTGLTAQRVCASVETFDTPVDINSSLTVDFREGAQASISVVGNCPVWWEDITIVCENWSFFLRQGELTYCTGDRGETVKMLSARYGGGSPDSNFVDAIFGRADLLAPSTCGLRTIELTEAAWRSAESGEPVSL
ncbi:MAG: Gfo/Idh/MocA family oxidoreductase [Candidatus Brocadiia bacterium]